MTFAQFYEKSYGINEYQIWYQGRMCSSKNAPDELWVKKIAEFEFTESYGKIICAVDLVD